MRVDPTVPHTRLLQVIVTDLKTSSLKMEVTAAVEVKFS
jgi:hypothetical protein